MKRISVVVSIVTALVITLVVAALSCNSGGSGNGTTSTMMSLDDPRNNYSSEYEAWDVWAYNNRVDEFTYSVSGRNLTVEQLMELQPPPEDWVSLEFMVDVNGCLVPYLLGYEAALVSHNTRTELTGMPGHLKAEGVMDPEMKRELDERIADIAATHHPVVPHWLAADLPEAAIFMPNGEIVTKQRLGFASESALAKDSDTLPPPGQGDPACYYLYTADGQLKKSACGPWVGLFVDETNWPVDSEVQTHPGGVVVFKNGTEVINVMEYDGTPLPNDTTVGAHPPYYGVLVDARALQWLHDHQVQTQN